MAAVLDDLILDEFVLSFVQRVYDIIPCHEKPHVAIWRLQIIWGFHENGAVAQLHLYQLGHVGW